MRLPALVLSLLTASILFAACSPVLPPEANTSNSAAPTASAPAATAQAAAPDLPVTLVDGTGQTVRVTDLSRIVVLNGDLAEVVWALGLGGNVVATDTSATYPAEARALQSLGYQRSLSAEGILSKAPTVVLGTQTAGPPAVIEQVRAAGVPLVIIRTEESLNAAPAKIRAVAAALGVATRGEELAGRVEAETQAAVQLGASATSKPRVAFVYVRGASVQVLGGAGTSADVIIRAVNARNAAAEAGLTGFAPMTAEALANAAPDIIVIPSAGLESAGGIDGLLAIPGIAQTPAGQQRRVVAMDDQYLLGFGPRSGLALAELARALHSELASR